MRHSNLDSARVCTIITVTQLHIHIIVNQFNIPKRSKKNRSDYVARLLIIRNSAPEGNSINKTLTLAINLS